MRLKELLAEDFGDEQNYSCSERLFAGANRAYNLGLSEDSFKTASCFSGGMMISGTCGALAGSLMALGYILVEDRAHNTPELRSEVQDFIMSFNKKFGAMDCALLKEKYRTPEKKCVPLQIEAAGILDDFLISIGRMDPDTGKIIDK